MRNVGAGLALIQQVRLRWHESGSIVTPDETTYLGGPYQPSSHHRSVRPWPSRSGRGSPRVDSIVDLKMFAAEVDYHDVSGQLAEMTRLEVVLVGEGAQSLNPWQVRQVHFYKAGVAEPYASSGVAAERAAS